MHPAAKVEHTVSVQVTATVPDGLGGNDGKPQAEMRSPGLHADAGRAALVKTDPPIGIRATAVAISKFWTPRNGLCLGRERRHSISNIEPSSSLPPDRRFREV
jgi:hypothetical protein